MIPADRRRRPLLRAAACGVVALAGLGFAPASVDARPYVPSGMAVTGGADAGAAVTLAPGVYVDTLSEGAATYADTGSVRYFAVSVRTGQTPYVAVTLAAPTGTPAGSQLGVRLSLTAQGETSACATESGSGLATDNHVDPVTVVAAPGPIGTEDGCPAGNLIVRVERSGDLAQTEPLGIEIAYRLEPAVASITGLPQPATTDQQKLTPALTGTPAALTSGDSFDSAPLVGSGIYKDTLTAGDIRIVRVHLGWGQRFAYAFSAAARSGVTSDDSVNATAEIRNPLRQVARQASGSSTTAFAVGRSDATMSGATAAPVRYLNRNSENTDIPAYANAGDYYLVIATGVRRAGDPALTYPYSLQIRVAGAAQSGPVYAGATTTTTAAPPADANGAGDNAAVVVVIVAGTGLLLIIVLVVFLLGRRRRNATATRQVRSHT